MLKRSLFALSFAVALVPSAIAQNLLLDAGQVMAGGSRTIGDLSIRAVVGTAELSGIEFREATHSEDGSVGNGLPDAYSLDSNYPNPFRTMTRMPYSLAEQAYVRIELVDQLGRVVERLVDRPQPAGRFTVEIQGRRLTPGLYFVRFEAGGFSRVRPVILID